MTNNKWTLEIIWWVFTFLLTIGILLPILSVTRDYYFLGVNVVFIIAFITLARYIFLLHLTFLSQYEWLKVVLVFVSPVWVFLLVQEVNNFQTYVDEYGWEAVLGDLPTSTLKNISNYTHSELLFFGVGSAISAALVPFRMVLSVWRVRNKGRE
jgi:hypothetical protein